MTLPRGITSKNNGNFYCLKCLHFLRIKNRLEWHKNVCESRDLCNCSMSPEDTEILGPY